MENLNMYNVNVAKCNYNKMQGFENQINPYSIYRRPYKIKCETFHNFIEDISWFWLS